MISLTEAQRIIALDAHRFRVVCCGRRAGKTTLAILEIIGKASGLNDGHICYIAPTFQQTRDIAWNELKKFAQPVILSTNEARLEIQIKNKYGGSSTIWLRGWESIETLRGQRFDFIVIDEIAMMRNWLTNWQEVLRPTLTDSQGECLFISTPKGFNHFYDIFNLENSDHDFKSFHFTSFDNPHIQREELEKARKELTENRFAQEYMADFRKTEGLVYKEFDRTKHVFDVLPKHNYIETLVGIDWGYTNPTCVLKILKDGDFNFYVTEEFYKRGKTTAEIVEYAATLRGNSYYPDPAEPDRILELTKKGLRVKEVSKEIEAGIDSVRELFKNNKLFISSQCVNTILELETYSYPDKKADRNEPELPIKENDHAMDVLRYILFMQQPARPNNYNVPRPLFEHGRIVGYR